MPWGSALIFRIRIVGISRGVIIEPAPARSRQIERNFTFLVAYPGRPVVMKRAAGYPVD